MYDNWKFPLICLCALYEYYATEKGIENLAI